MLVVYIFLAIALPSQLILEYWVKYIHKDGRTNQHRLKRKLLLCLNILAGLIILAYNLSKEVSSQKAGKKLGYQISEVNSNVTGGFDNLSSVLKTNPALSPEAKTALLVD